jgi:hypothetical protein
MGWVGATVDDGRGRRYCVLCLLSVEVGARGMGLKIWL